MNAKTHKNFTSLYRYSFVGLEKDDEIKGNGNSYNTEFRQYDPRLGRWFAPDKYKAYYPSSSQYSYALNTPISAKDENGLYTIFVNGYIYGGAPTSIDDLKPNYPYWRCQYCDNPGQFIKAAHEYFGDGNHQYENGTGNSIISDAKTRFEEGYDRGQQIAQEILEQIKSGVKVDEINIVSHSMGAAYAEGIVKALMEDESLATLMEKGEIVHFSASDGDEIQISENSKQLLRSQINYLNDKTLELKDPLSIYGGYRIPGIRRFGYVDSNVEDWGLSKSDPDHDFHVNSKIYREAFEALKVLDEQLELKLQNNMVSPIQFNINAAVKITKTDLDRVKGTGLSKDTSTPRF